MVGGMNSISMELASMYSANQSILAEVLGRIASGKKIRNPADDFVNYVRAKSMQQTIDGYDVVKQDLTELRGVSTMATTLGNSIYEDLTRMKQLATLYNKADATTDEKDAYNAEFKALGKSIMDTISNNKYEGVAVVSAATLKTVFINPDNTSDTLGLTFTAGDIIADVSGESDVGHSTWHLDDTTLDGGEVGKTAANLQTEIDKATSYLIKAEGYTTKIDRQLTMTDTIVTSKQAAQSLITDIDDAEELSKATEMQIRQQATIAMISQANMERAGLMKLFM
jgi:flagellin